MYLITLIPLFVGQISVTFIERAVRRREYIKLLRPLSSEEFHFATQLHLNPSSVLPLSLASRNNINNSNKTLNTNNTTSNNIANNSQKGHNSDLISSRYSTNDLPNIPSSSSSTANNPLYAHIPTTNKKASSLKLTRSSSHPIPLPSGNIHSNLTLASKHSTNNSSSQPFNSTPSSPTSNVNSHIQLASKPSHSSLQTTDLKINLAEFIVMEMLRSEL